MCVEQNTENYSKLSLEDHCVTIIEDLLTYKKVLLRERTRHTARCVASTPLLSYPGRGGGGLPPPPHYVNWQTKWNYYLPQPSDAGGKNVPLFWQIVFCKVEAMLLITLCQYLSISLQLSKTIQRKSGLSHFTFSSFLWFHFFWSEKILEEITTLADCVRVWSWD